MNQAQFEKGVFTEMTEDQIREAVQKEGFNPTKFTDEPDYRYKPHTHPETKLLVFLGGSMILRAGDDQYECHRGDKLIIPGNIVHSAVVGPEGCTFFWSEKIL